MSDPLVYRPKKIGELFNVEMPDGQRVLARVTEITDENHWTAVNADLDDAMISTGDEPTVQVKQEGRA